MADGRELYLESRFWSGSVQSKYFENQVDSIPSLDGGLRLYEILVDVIDLCGFEDISDDEQRGSQSLPCVVELLEFSTSNEGFIVGVVSFLDSFYYHESSVGGHQALKFIHALF